MLDKHKGKSQEITQAIEYFKANGQRPTPTQGTQRVYCPWSWYERIDVSARLQVKSMMVKPGEKPSMKVHQHRVEHYVVFSGTAIVTVADKEKYLFENQ